MKILYITSRFPYPPLKGDKIRAFYPIQHLSANHQIDLLSFEDSAPELADIKYMSQYCRKIRIILIGSLKLHMLLSAGIFTWLPSQVFCYRSADMLRSIAEFSQTDQYDAVHIVCGRLANYGRLLPKTPKLIDWIDAFSLSTERQFREESNPVKKLGYFWEWIKMKRFEESWSRRLDYSIITSQVDRTYLNNRIDEVVANGVDTETFSYRADAVKDIDLIYTGNMSYTANISAIVYFIEKIWPSIIGRRPETSFYIVGTNPHRDILQYKRLPKVFITGFVDSIVPYLNRSRVFVAPMVSGAGIQNKILEAMACGIPVVTTQYGNGGIGAINGEEIIVCENSHDFSKMTIRLMENDEESVEIGKKGRKLIEKKFSWKTKTERIDYIYRMITQKNRSSD